VAAVAAVRAVLVQLLVLRLEMVAQELPIQLLVRQLCTQVAVEVRVRPARPVVLEELAAVVPAVWV
jgi:hypothetical protein